MFLDMQLDMQHPPPSPLRMILRQGNFIIQMSLNTLVKHSTKVIDIEISRKGSSMTCCQCWHCPEAAEVTCMRPKVMISDDMAQQSEMWKAAGIAGE
jgi:hypothetical protein